MLNFQNVLNSSPEVKEYFGLYAKNSDECMKLALELMKEAIAIRKKKSERNKSLKINAHPNEVKNEQQIQIVAQPKTNHHNVAYIKHNRFLSPSQKKQITPKVTQIIPIPSQDHVIYGKPKVKLDQFEGCEIHHRENCLEQSYENDNSSSVQEQSVSNQNDIPLNENKLYDDGVQILQNQKQQQAMQIPYQYEEYLSPKNKGAGKKKKNGHDWNKTVKEGQKVVRQNQSISGLLSPKGNKQTNASPKARMTSPKSNMFSNQCCPPQNYSNVESKIKQLIIRDKRNREVEKQLQRQKQEIDEIEERQNKLLIAQKQREEKLKMEAILEMEKEKQRQRERERELERELEKQREKEREIEKQREIQIQVQLERQRQRQREMLRELQIQKELQIRREIERERQRSIIRQIQERQAAQAWRIRYQEQASKLNQQMMIHRNYDLEGDATSSQSSSIVNLHDHQLQQSRVQCYQCEIQRLRKQKQRAKQAIRQIELQEAKRSQVLMEIAQNSQLETDYYRRYNNSMIH